MRCTHRKETDTHKQKDKYYKRWLRGYGRRQGVGKDSRNLEHNRRDTRRMRKNDKSRVQINYKSGLSMVIECDEFKITRSGSGPKSYAWADANPRPMLLGADDIESVWELQ